MADIKFAPNGPILVSGDDVKLHDLEGNEVAAPGPVIALCRCSHSSNRPFCDGAHSKADWDGSCPAFENKD